jgi:hypothetical protein
LLIANLLAMARMLCPLARSRSTRSCMGASSARGLPGCRPRRRAAARPARVRSLMRSRSTSRTAITRKQNQGLRPCILQESGSCVSPTSPVCHSVCYLGPAPRE